jgi:hypothetical protein
MRAENKNIFQKPLDTEFGCVMVPVWRRNMEQIIGIAITSLVSPVILSVVRYIFSERRNRRRQEETTEKFALELHRLKMLALKCVITNNELSRQARLDAYDEYRKAGGNSWVHDYVVKNLHYIED